ncbi:MAG TPA: PAS domain S-box protein [Candidatus Dormibacteraeota bacterium]|nr:PAS domain S-box protein [Candidatus Dormibacteraeota bacterium]
MAGTRQKVRQSDEQLRALMDAISDYAIFLLDADGMVTTWSDAAERIKGYAAEEIVGRHFSVFYPEDALARGTPDEGLVIAAREGRFEEEGWRIRKDGTRFFASVVISPIRDATGELAGFAKVTRDITERKENEERASLLRNLEDRQDIANRLHKTAIGLLFDVGIDLQGLALRTHEADTRERLEAAVSKLDDAIRQLRSFVFHPDKPDGP